MVLSPACHPEGAALPRVEGPNFASRLFVSRRQIRSDPSTSARHGRSSGRDDSPLHAPIVRFRGALAPHRKPFGEPALPLRLGAGHGGRRVVAKQVEPDREVVRPTHRHRGKVADSRTRFADQKHRFALTGDYDPPPKERDCPRSRLFVPPAEMARVPAGNASPYFKEGQVVVVRSAIAQSLQQFAFPVATTALR